VRPCGSSPELGIVDTSVSYGLKIGTSTWAYIPVQADWFSAVEEGLKCKGQSLKVLERSHSIE